MASYFDDAQAKNADHKRRLLEAMAQGGMAGKQSFEQAQQSITANRVSALDRLLSGAQERNAGSAAEQELATIAGTSSQRNLDNLASSRQSHEQNLGAMRQANSNYFDQAAAAVPAIQAASDRELALYRAQQQAKADADAAKASSDMSNAELKVLATGAAASQQETAEQQLARVLAQRAAIDARTASGGPGMGLRGYETTAGQASQAQAAELERQFRALEAQVGARGQEPGPLPTAVDDMQTNPYLYRRQAAADLSGDPMRAAGIFPEPSPAQRYQEAVTQQKIEDFGQAPDPAAKAAKIKPETAESIRKSKEYAQVVATLEDKLAEGLSDRNDFLRALEAAPMLRGKPEAKRLIREEYYDRFPGSRPREE